jgi:polyphosphate kinase 2 (PPK2 family)
VPKSLYEPDLERLQAELVGMQQWVVEMGARVPVIFEGRDAAGKGGAIKRIVQYQCTPGVSSAFGYAFS